ncbi:carboxypeptidase-like regulatory domain-containing protein [Terriglobus albidus]|uniref:carboxypeptidase-like regulatory domain-containing protein n=1 Tax=Terriglobus albidus TaxID=1592106 RepID=UPI0021E0AF8E|nr:carboxypeptidase-like regulatory domain-containing protein [Terriglobus albidus]
MYRGIKTFLAIFALLASTLSVVAQSERGAITGRITDNTGSILPDAAITLRNEATGVQQTTKSNNDGVYTFPSLNPGSYTLTVNRTGFKRLERTHTVVDVNATNQQDASLEIGETSEVVEVRAGVQQLQETSGSMGMIVEERSIQELPSIYGNPFTLQNLAPGIIPSGVNPNIHTYDSGTANVSVNGSVLNSLEYRLDGAPDNRIRLSAYTPSTEFINQYRVETSSYDASQGHSAGGFVNVALKSGTNAFHGSAFGYYQNPTLNSNYWHLGGTPAAKAVWLREGGSVGGPVWRDHAFFFTGWEHSRAATPNVLTFGVPPTAFRNGDFSALLPKYQLYDPYSGRTVNSKVVRDPFPGNIIPGSRISPIAAAALKYYPQPNTATSDPAGASNYSYAGAEPDYYYAYVVRSDVAISNRQSIYGHYVQSRRLQPGKNAYFGQVSGTTLTYRNKGAAVGYTFVLSPTTVLEARVSWTRFVNQNVVPSQGILNATSIGMPAYLVNGLGPNAQAFPRLDITGYQSLNSDNGVISHNDITMGSVQISRTLGRHFFRTGYEYRMYNVDAGITTQSNGRYQHTGTYTQSTSGGSSSIDYSLAQFEMGLPNSSAITINSDLAVRSNYMAGWFHDDFKALPNLTINLGLRYEYEGPNSERNQKANTYFDFNTPNPIAAAAQAKYATIASSNSTLPAASAWTVNGGLRFLGEQGFDRKDYDAQKLMLLPRIGFSWRFMDNTVMRGGYGLFADSLSTFYLSGGNAGSTSTFLLPQQGFTATTSQSATTDNVTFTAPISNPFPSGIAQPTGNSLGMQTFLGNSVTFQPRNPQVPYNQRWSFGFQRAFGSWLAAVDYVGNHGLHLPVNKEFDAVPRQYLSTATNGYDVDAANRMSATVTNPFQNIAPTTVSLGSGKTVAVSQLVRPYPEFTGVTAYMTNGMSIYHSLQAQLLRRFSNGASFTSAFTWSKSLDATQYLNNSDSSLWYGTSSNDRTFRFATSGIYQLPFGRGRQYLHDNAFVSALVGGWQMQGVYQVQSGQPLSFTPAGTSPLYKGTNPVDAAWGRSGYKASAAAQATGAAGYWFNINSFVTKTTNTLTSGIDTSATPNQYQIRTFPIRFSGLRADFLNQWDMALQRNFSLARFYEPLQLQFRAEATNLLNHPVYSAPSTDWTNTAFGQITSQANQPRVWQWVAIVRF